MSTEDNGGREPAASALADIAPKREVHLLDYVKILYKRRWLAMSAFLIVSVTSAVRTYTATPIYQAKVSLLIEKENANVVNFKEAFEQNQITDDYYQTQYKILQSRALARRTMDTLKLWTDPEFNAPPHSRWARLRLMAPPYLQQFMATAPPATPIAPAAPIDPKAQLGLIDAFLSHLTISPVRNSRLVDIRYELPNPRLAADIANALAKNYIEQNLEFKFLASKEASDWLGERLAEQRKQVEASEQALQRYREQTESVSLEERQNIVVQKLGDLNTAVTRAKTERIQKEAAYDQIRAVQNDRSGLDTIPAILSNAYIQQQKGEIAELQRHQSQLSEKLGPNHPDMRKVAMAIEQAELKLQAETFKVVQAIKNDYQTALAQERSLVAALDQQKQEAMQLNRKGIDYGVLQRDAATNRQIFDSLLQRTKETGISGELKTSNVRIVDAAEVPRGPSYPDNRGNILLGSFLGVVLALTLTFFLEYMDNRIKTPDEIRTELGLPFLGMVPVVFDRHAGDPLINNGVPANFSESFRTLRTNVLFSSTDQAHRTMLVTSAGPGEGKTMVAANIAIALAQTGQKVLLVDADMRKPRVHSVFEFPQEPGLSNILVGNAKPSEAVQYSTSAGLWAIPAGKYPPNPAELLGSKRFKDFMTSMSQHFDWVVIDTPPVMAVTDASVLAHMVDGVLFVVAAEMTSRHASRTALEQLQHARASFLGGVLNRVDLKHNAYYYSQYYRREYTDYYKETAHT